MMTLEKIVGGIIAAIIPLIFWRQYKLNDRLSKTLTREEVEELMDRRVEHMDQKVSDTYSYIVRVDKKLDTIILELTRKPNTEADKS